MNGNSFSKVTIKASSFSLPGDEAGFQRVMNDDYCKIVDKKVNYSPKEGCYNIYLEWEEADKSSDGGEIEGLGEDGLY